MSKWHQTHPIALVAIWLVTMLPRGSVSASHFSWLGHSECPDGAAACETLIPAGFTALGQFEVAHYRILDEAAPEWRTEPRDEPLLSRDGTVITHVGRKFKAQLEREGSARLRDGRIINAEERVRGRWRYLVIQDAPFGIGAPGYKLMPYRTLSVDAKRIPLGTVLYVPALVGVALPNGDIHDGFVFAHDMNDNKTVHNTIHLFLGFNASTTLSLKQGMAKRLVRVYQADRDTAAVLNRRFKAQFDWSG
jgi:3D (Asp-Asp-Asp) domain-containing protein